MSNLIDLIGKTIAEINCAAVLGCNSRSIIATPEALNGAKISANAEITEGLVLNVIKAARAELITSEGSVIAGAASRLKKLGVVVHTVKLSDNTGVTNALVYFQTKQGIIVIWKHASTCALIDAMVDWGVPETVKEVIKEVEVVKEVKVPAVIPSGWFQRLLWLFK